MPSINYTLMSV